MRRAEPARLSAADAHQLAEPHAARRDLGWAWTAGILGAFYVVSTIVAGPRLGAALLALGALLLSRWRVTDRAPRLTSWRPNRKRLRAFAADLQRWRRWQTRSSDAALEPGLAP